jgi:hypothetical protein
MTSGLMIRQSGLSRLVNVKTPRVVILSLILFTQGCREQGNTATKPDDGDLPSTTKTAKDPTGLIGRAQARSTGQFEFIDQHGLAFTHNLSRYVSATVESNEGFTGTSAEDGRIRHSTH